MNQGKICVSVCAKTAEELIKQIKRAQEFADVIEIRFDCLDVKEFNYFLRKFKRKEYSKYFLTTFRPSEQGGNKELTFEQREEFWLRSHIFEFTDWADLELDFSAEKIKNMWRMNAFDKIIKSFHDFNGVPENLNEIFENIRATNPDVIKIAIQTTDITDAIPIWQLLKCAKSENKEIIPIAMGESGKWTRILGLAHGAFMTYASLDSDKETAPGQVTAQDLNEMYRAKELDETTDVYGVLGSNTNISLSPLIHNTAFKFHRQNSVFVPLRIYNLDEFMKRMVKPETREVELNFKGFAVTIPHKQNIIKHLDYLDETAEKIGAVNTVKIVDGKLHGYNTDAKGFIEPLKKAYGDLKGAKVAVLGAGGSARACVYALKENGADVTIFARDLAKAKVLADEFEVKAAEIPNPKSQIPNPEILVNTTPLGMKGKAEGESPVSAEQMKGAKLVYDLVYIPRETEFIKQAKSLQIPTIGGIEMLISQAIEQQRIWTGLEIPIEKISEVVLKKLSN